MLDKADMQTGGVVENPHLVNPQTEKTSSEPVSMDGVFSDMYDRLVNDEGDLPGLIAYGFYQLEKREWARAYLHENKRPPTSEQAREFSSRYQESAMRSLKERADGILYRYASAYEKEQAPVLQKKAFNDKTLAELIKLHDRINEIGRLRHHVFGHLLGFIYLLLIVFLVVKVLPSEPHVARWFGLEQYNPEAPRATPSAQPSVPAAQ